MTIDPTMAVTFFVPGRPAPQGSKKHVGGGRMVETSPYLKRWRAAVTTTAQVVVPAAWDTTAPMTAEVIFYLPRPKKHYGAGRNADLRGDAPDLHTCRPDVDKLLRAVLDGCTGVLWGDDSQIVTVHGGKAWASPDAAGARVTATLLSPGPGACCWACDGTGRVRDTPCMACDGTGRRP